MRKGFFEKNWLVHKILDECLAEAARKYAGGRLLDIGCGEKPHKDTFAPYVSEHIGVDHPASFHPRQNVDLTGTAYKIPVDDGSFDCILCSAVLEHLEEPDRALAEAHRVLKKNGTAIYLVPLFWHLHEEPRDFFRFTRYGIRYLFEKNGFEIVELKPLCGFWVTFGQELVYYLWRWKRFRFLSPGISFLGGIIQAGAYFLDKIDRAEEFTWMYLVAAKKK